MYRKETRWKGEDWVHLAAWDRNRWQADVNVMIIVLVS